MSEIYTRNYYLEREEVIECEYARMNVLRPDQAETIGYITLGPRKAIWVLSVGSGICTLETALYRIGFNVIASDPSSAAKEIALERGFRGRYLNVGFNEAIRLPHPYDTVIFNESLEHISPEEFEKGFSFLAKRKDIRIIITNRKEYFPIGENGWDHVMVVDARLFRRFMELGETLICDGSHLVVQT